MTALPNKILVLGIYRGWWATFVAFFMAFFAWGTVFYGNGYYIRVLNVEHGWEISSLSACVGLSYAAGVPATLVIGKIIDRFGTRWVAVTGAFLLGGGIAALAEITAIWQLAVIYIFLGIGYPCLATITVSSTVIPWFKRRLGLALGTALTGASIGGMSVVPIMTILTDRTDFRTTTYAVGLTIIIVLLPLILTIIRPPRDGELLPRETVVLNSTTGPDAAISYRTFLSSFSFWRITLASSLGLAAQVGFLTHQISAMEVHIGIHHAAFAVSVTAGAAIFGRFALGALSGRVPSYLLACICYIIQAIALVIIAFADGLVALYAASALGGLVVGSIVMLPPLLLSEAFGQKSYGAAFGLTNIGMFLSVTVAVAVAGILRDYWGEYMGVFLTLAGLHVAAVVVTIVGNKLRTSS